MRLTSRLKAIKEYVQRFFARERDNNLIVLHSNVSKRTEKATGISRRTVQRVCAEFTGCMMGSF